MGVAELASYWRGEAAIVADTVTHPVWLSWPMGFAWSSFLAHSTLLHQCLVGGLKLNKILKLMVLLFMFFNMLCDVTIMR